MAPKADSAEGIILNFVNEIALEFLPEKLVSNLRKHYDSLPLNYAQAGFEMKDVFLHIKLIEQAAVEDNPAIMIQEISDEETNVNGSVLKLTFASVPIKQGHKLRFVWPITPGIHNYKEGPSRYLGHLVGHEGEGSLFYILKKLVSIDLTDAGQEHFEDIVALLFKSNGPLHDGKGRETLVKNGIAKRI
ncbi:Protein kinase superfamily protein [Perilla frutescens var. frutescens]|nr:Protein kinase superfamily protein [Perilla frutescens var. frutescens]